MVTPRSFKAKVRNNPRSSSRSQKVEVTRRTIIFSFEKLTRTTVASKYLHFGSKPCTTWWWVPTQFQGQTLLSGPKCACGSSSFSFPYCRSTFPECVSDSGYAEDRPWGRIGTYWAWLRVTGGGWSESCDGWIKWWGQHGCDPWGTIQTLCSQWISKDPHIWMFFVLSGACTDIWSSVFVLLLPI